MWRKSNGFSQNLHHQSAIIHTILHEGIKHFPNLLPDSTTDLLNLKKGLNLQQILQHLHKLYPILIFNHHLRLHNLQTTMLQTAGLLVHCSPLPAVTKQIKYIIYVLYFAVDVTHVQTLIETFLAQVHILLLIA